MAKKYTEKEVYNTACDFFKKEKDIAKLYAENFIRWRSGRMEYSEIISDVLLKNDIKKRLDAIEPYERSRSYKIQHRYNRKNVSHCQQMRIL